MVYSSRLIQTKIKSKTKLLRFDKIGVTHLVVALLKVPYDEQYNHALILQQLMAGMLKKMTTGLWF